MLTGVAFVLALAAGIFAAHVKAFALDETLIQQSAVHYTGDLPHSLFHDLDARATNRLYSLLLSVAYHLFGGVNSIRVDHVLSVVLFISTVFPLYLMGRVILRSAWFAVAFALLSVVVPWLTLTSALFTENLSYPLFWWTVLAVCAAVWRPSIRSDLLALLAIGLLVCTRVQFAAVFLGYIPAIVLVEYLRVEGSRSFWRRLGSGIGASARGHIASFLLLVAGVVVLLYEHSQPTWSAKVTQALGTYSNVIIRNGLPSNMFEGLLVELIALALGVGLLPAIVSIAWWCRSITRPTLDRRWVFLAASSIVLVVFLVLTVYSQGGYLGPITEERYFFYVIPVFWLGTFAALEDGQVRAGELLIVSLALAAVFASIPFLSPLSQETAFLAPAESVVPHVMYQRLIDVGLTGLSIQDALAILTVVAGVLALALWPRSPRGRAWIIGIAVTLQLLLTGYAFATIDGRVPGIQGRTGGSFAAVGWLERAAGSAKITWLDNESIALPPAATAAPAEDQLHTALFWTPNLIGWAEVPGIGVPPVEFPLAARPGVPSLSVDLTSGAITPAPAAAGIQGYVVGQNDSPFLQLRGSVVARSSDGVLMLTRIERPPYADWLAVGLLPDGFIGTGPAAKTFLFAPSSSSPQAVAVAMTFVPVPGATTGTVVNVRLGSVARQVRLTSNGAPQVLHMTACLPAGVTAIQGAIGSGRSALVAGRNVAGGLASVELSPEPAAPAHC